MGRVSYFLFLQLLAISCHHGLAKPSDHPERPKHQIQKNSIVSIQEKGSSMPLIERHLCSGVIISEKHVLTESGCLTDYDFSKNETLSLDLEDIQIVVTEKGGSPASENSYDVESLRFFDEAPKYGNPAPTEVVVITLKEPVDLTANPKANISNQNSRGKPATLLAWNVRNRNEDTLFMEQVPLNTLRQDECEQLLAKLWHPNVHMNEDIFCSVRSDHPNKILDLQAFSGAVITDDVGVIALGYFATFCDPSSDPPKCLIFHDSIERYRKFVGDVIRAAASS